MRILHLSADYPDPIATTKTKAVRNLLELAPQHEHHVFSLNRIAWHLPLSSRIFADSVSAECHAISYPAPPKGFLHRHSLHRLADWIWSECQRRNVVPDAIHAHKLTVEGIAGRILADRFGVPLIVSVQGNTDLKITRAKPGLRAEFRRIWHSAEVALPFAPWAQNALNRLLGHRKGPTHCLPCPGPADQIIAPTTALPIVRSAFNLTDHRNKNAGRLIRAIGIVSRDVPDVRLELIGGGPDNALATLKQTADRHAPGRVRFLGPIPHDQIQAMLSTSAAFALVSHRESFGMVFAEALLSGVPCLIPNGRAIDGYLPEGSVTLSANSSDTASIASGLIRLLQDQSDFKARLLDHQQSGKLEFLRRDAISQVYANALNAALVESPIATHAATATPKFAPA